MATTNTHDVIQPILEFADHLHQSGFAPYSVSKYTEQYALKHGVEATIDVTPSKIMAIIEKPNQSVVIQNKTPPSVNLRQLVSTLRSLKNHSPITVVGRYSFYTLGIANILLPPCYLMLVGSTYCAVLLSVFLGLIAWVIQCQLSHKSAILTEFIVALIASIVVGIASGYAPDLPVLALCISSVVLFIPGLTITNALASFSVNDYRSGIELLAQSGFVIMKLFIGIVLGLTISRLFISTPDVTNYINEIPPITQFVALVGISTGIGVIFNADAKDIAISLPAAIIGMWGPHWITPDWIVGTWISSMLITLYGLLVGKMRGTPPIVYIVQGIIILVPGSRIMVGASESFFETSVLATPNIGLSALLMFCSIMAGQLVIYSFMSKSFFLNVD
ncbi:hypothetical protein BCU70_09805 [Vibrio sp. 10N.286.49.C2]|uniref:threonine/serine exporter family protein n=1 Tax=unclassified Vibrio TaxID=2614977 RepID=UPI000C83A955|nr:MULTISPECIES: threonine/serine exporter family protein [unclassified Vibrio]PMH26435.1 hypothetical protein BCU70_09805 [Vibrio sp. 10N.286.49.C2]PMH54841.1 hypothetical protein BCU66_11130 [Vibrio sp. 10N.286.49.B1]PMH82097.1 hypothetical protein BCU58_19365 [Vibrio sp. 10N.286.48.B7]